MRTRTPLLPRTKKLLLALWLPYTGLLIGAGLLLAWQMNIWTVAAACAVCSLICVTAFIVAASNLVAQAQTVIAATQYEGVDAAPRPSPLGLWYGDSGGVLQEGVGDAESPYAPGR